MDKDKAKEQLNKKVVENIERLKSREDLTEDEVRRLQFLLGKEIELQKELEKESSTRRNNPMLSKLFKLAYRLDKGGLYDEARAIDEVVAELANRVGLKMEPDEMISIANFLDEQGESVLASKFDDMLLSIAKKKDNKYKTHKGKDEKKPEGAEHKAPKGWFDKMKKDVKKKNPDYSDKRVSEIVGDIWDNELSDAKREKIYKEHGKKKSPNE